MKQDGVDKKKTSYGEEGEENNPLLNRLGSNDNNNSNNTLPGGKYKADMNKYKKKTGNGNSSSGYNIGSSSSSSFSSGVTYFDTRQRNGSTPANANANPLQLDLSKVKRAPDHIKPPPNKPANLSSSKRKEGLSTGVDGGGSQYSMEIGLNDHKKLYNHHSSSSAAVPTPVHMRKGPVKGPISPETAALLPRPHQVLSSSSSKPDNSVSQLSAKPSLRSFPAGKRPPPPAGPKPTKDTTTTSSGSNNNSNSNSNNSGSGGSNSNGHRQQRPPPPMRPPPGYIPGQSSAKKA